MLLLNLSLISSLLFFASARDVGGPGNLTVTFFRDLQRPDCLDRDISKGVTLTTSSTPTEFTCFNLTDIFSQSNDTGFQGAWEPLIDKSAGVDWYLQNRDNFDPKEEYTQVVYEMLNKTTVNETGQASAWLFFVYPFPDCQQLIGHDLNQDDYPWFVSTCQTEKGGAECQLIPNSIKSFAILSDQKEGKCKPWAKFAAASKVGGRVLPLASALATVAGLFLVL